MLTSIVAAIALAPQDSARFERNLLPVGTIAPEFSLPRLRGGTWAQRTGEGNQPTVYVFWSLGGSGSLPQLQFLETYLAESRRSFRLVSINHADDPERVQAFVQENKLKEPCLLNTMGDADVAKRYGVIGFPTVYVLGRDGRIAARFYNPGRDQVVQALSAL